MHQQQVEDSALHTALARDEQDAYHCLPTPGKVMEFMVHGR